jgi:gamma-glutamyltranspeptidase/glutathione hydrolase
MIRAIVVFVGATVLFPVLAWAQESSHGNTLPTTGRSVIATRYGIVAASQPLAATAGIQILERGGNAVDAAIATNSVIGLMEPTSNGIGGDLFAIVYEAKTGKVYGLNSSGWAPQKLTPEFLAAKGVKEMPQRGIDSATVPGAVAGWQALHDRFGTLPLSTLLKPAIYYAENGVAINEVTAGLWGRSVAFLASHPNSAATYLIDGRAPKPGEVFPQCRSREKFATNRR